MVRALARTLGVLVCAVLALTMAAPAQAHDQLISSVPEAGATVDSPPSEVTLTFSASIGEEFAQVAVVGQDGTAYQSGDPVVEGPTLTQAVEGLPTGEQITVSYRIVSSDGHPIGGTVPFSIAADQTGGASADDAQDAQTTVSGDGEDAASQGQDEDATVTAPAGTVTSRSAGAAQDDSRTDETATTASTTDAGPSGLIWLIGGVAAAAVGGLGVLLARRSSRQASEQRVTTDA
jgi:hypothetical protein